jgi:hypothetical protein
LVQEFGASCELAVILNQHFMGLFDFFKNEAKIEMSLNTAVFTKKNHDRQ